MYKNTTLKSKFLFYIKLKRIQVIQLPQELGTLSQYLGLHLQQSETEKRNSL